MIIIITHEMQPKGNDARGDAFGIRTSDLLSIASKRVNECFDPTALAADSHFKLWKPREGAESAFQRKQHRKHCPSNRVAEIHSMAMDKSNYWIVAGWHCDKVCDNFS
jgi:hypothetical protein